MNDDNRLRLLYDLYISDIDYNDHYKLELNDDRETCTLYKRRSIYSKWKEIFKYSIDELVYITYDLPR
jgi:hypothetical protein